MAAKLNYTKRNNGRLMLDVRPRVILEQFQVTDLAAALGCSEAAAVDRWRLELEGELSTLVCFRCFARNATSGEIEFMHSDDVGRAGDEEAEWVYVGGAEQ